VPEAFFCKHAFSKTKLKSMELSLIVTKFKHKITNSSSFKDELATADAKTAFLLVAAIVFNTCK